MSDSTSIIVILQDVVLALAADVMDSLLQKYEEVLGEPTSRSSDQNHHGRSSDHDQPAGLPLTESVATALLLDSHYLFLCLGLDGAVASKQHGVARSRTASDDGTAPQDSGGSSADLERLHSQVCSLLEQIQAHVDPVNWMELEPHLHRQVYRLHEQSSLLLGPFGHLHAHHMQQYHPGLSSNSVAHSSRHAPPAQPQRGTSTVTTVSGDAPNVLPLMPVVPSIPLFPVALYPSPYGASS